MNILKKPTTGTKMEDIKKLKAKAMALEPIVRIGKSGLTETVMTEIKKQLNQKQLIKIKMLKSFVGREEKKDAAKQIAEKTNSRVVYTIGFVVVLAKKL